MGKKRTAEVDERQLKKKVGEKLAAVENPEGDPTLRSLRKRLKRVQRKRRLLDSRRRLALGKTPSAPSGAQAGS